MNSPSETESVVYLDYNATHPPFPQILEENFKNYSRSFFNPSGITRFSLRNQGKIEAARKYFASSFGTKENDLVFSSTGTEANYLLLQCLKSELKNLEIISSPFEHSSMIGAYSDLGFKPEFLKTDKSGQIQLAHLRELLETNPRPVVCLMAGNETGVIQPMKEIFSLCQEFGTYLFSDLMQAFCKIEIDFSLFDGFTCSAHKIGGGLGSALTVFKNLPKDHHLFQGGNQENNHRAGTENFPSILSFADSARLQLDTLKEKNLRLKSFQKLIEDSITEWGAEIVAKDSPRLPNTTFAILPFEDIDFLLMGLESKGICISTGSSCKSRAREASTSLLKMGYSNDEALRAIRISTGYFSTEAEIQFFLNELRTLALSLQN
jgi:cysteine desulfurase